jgi:hypothetical protein
VPAVAAAAVVAIVLINGVPRGTDWSFELVRVVEMRAAFASGQIPPFWAPDEYRGFGSPVFLFYAPLFAWIASAISMRGAIVLFVIVAALVMRAAAAEVADTPMQGIAIVALVLHPYFLGDIWLRNANAELAALAFLPGVIAGAIARDARRRFWWTALSVTGVVLAHNLTALVACAMSIGIAAYVQRRRIGPTLAGIATALVVTSFFWVPALALKQLGVRDDALLGGHFDFRHNFPPFASFFVVDAHRAYAGLGILSIAMFAAVVLAGFFVPIEDDHSRRVVQASAIAGAVLIFLMLPLSAFIWDLVPMMRYLQFPWRLAGPFAVVTVIGFVAAFRSTRALQIGFVVIAALMAAPLFLAYQSVSKEQLAIFTPDRVNAFGLRSTVGDDYLPRGADKRLIVMPTPQVPGYTVFRRWAFPVWRSNGEVVALPGGIVGVRGQNRSIVLAEPRIRTVTKIISAIAIVLLFLGLRRQSRRFRPHGSKAVALPPQS